ncbi:hypothetical protein EPUS_08924 [Endocarpon pusillum Z07020]|uniref:BTB domain-containing protein n=1 Tax=Endocarpon pusillum (strain Z07020 / HMAS-L-300199) TaxID=1263415 RepID=U1HGI5_ENDPU|nr:uncharacterized protein EPUS_08924 [Endocarpon pusillum Z07020]ERF69245.1 hypothetical protein EPUS_08924 [Endocarpon pusillum Z07020]
MASYEDDDLPHKSINDAQLMGSSGKFSNRYFAQDALSSTCVSGREHSRSASPELTCSLTVQAPLFMLHPLPEGETKTVDFDDDDAYSVEALLIYLYTLEYPNRKAHKFEEPPPKAGGLSQKRRPRRFRLQSGPVIKDPSADPVPMIIVQKVPYIVDNERETKSTRFKLKSEAPKETWQERLGLYRIAHRLNLTNLCKISLGIMRSEIDSALRATNADEFIREVYSLDQDEAQSIKEDIATKIAEAGPQTTCAFVLYSLLRSHPFLGCNLVKAMRANEERRTEMTTKLRVTNDQQAKEIDGYKQQLAESWHEAEERSELASMAERRLQDEKTEAGRLSKTTTQLRKELRECKEALAKQETETAECREQIDQLEKEGKVAKKPNRLLRHGRQRPTNIIVGAEMYSG